MSDLSKHPQNYAMQYQSKHYPPAWEGKVPKSIVMLKDVQSDLPLILPGGTFSCDSARVYQVICNSHGAVSAWVGPGEDDFLGLKPDEFEIVGWWELKS
jgi:hypothetical protein